MLAHRSDGRSAIFRQQRIGHPVGKVAVGLVMQLDKLKRQVRFQQVDHPAGAAVARIHHYFQGLQAGHIDIGQQVLDIGLVGIQRVQLPGLAPRVNSFCSASCLISSRPVSAEIGRDSSRTNFMPL